MDGVEHTFLSVKLPCCSPHSDRKGWERKQSLNTPLLTCARRGVRGACLEKHAHTASTVLRYLLETLNPSKEKRKRTEVWLQKLQNIVPSLRKIGPLSKPKDPQVGKGTPAVEGEGAAKCVKRATKLSLRQGQMHGSRRARQRMQHATPMS